MGRKGVLLGFWLFGYVFGIAAWYMRGPALEFIQNLGLSSDAAQALLAGLFGSGVMVFTVLIWSFLSSSS